MQIMTLSVLGLGPTAFAQVRVGWQRQGQPAWTVDEDVVILNAVEDDDAYNRTRDVQYEITELNPPGGLTQVTTYTRVWRVMWTFYGPNSFDRARQLRSGLFLQAPHDSLALSNLYLVTDVSAMQRVPELFEQQWWERVDFSCQFNEAVTEIPIVNAVKSVEVTVDDAVSSEVGTPLADVTITHP